MKAMPVKKRDIETRITQRELLPVSTSTASSFFYFYSVLPDRYGFKNRQIRMLFFGK
jgi:hypothetical protein